MMRPAALALSLHMAAAATYLPGVAPRSYSPEETLKLYVNKLTSTHTQIPYDYYSLPFCHPKIKGQAENLGERLAGDRIENSLYKLSVLKQQPCKIVCRKKMTKIGAKRFARAIDDDYRVHWLVDNLPASTLLTNKVDPTRPYHVRGFPVGFRQEDEAGKAQHFLFNHVKLVVSVHRAVEASERDAEERLRVVGFRVEPYSIDHSYDETKPFSTKETQLTTCSAQRPARNDPTNYQRVDKPGEVVFTYDVEWEDSATPWSNRWDVFLQGNPDDKIHWFSITNSTMIVVFLTVMVAMILVRTLSQDIAHYNDAALLDEAKEESGWKLVHADVFRPPSFSPMLFSVFIGSGVQLGCMVMMTLVCALFGVLSPANRGSLLTAMLMLYVFAGGAGGHAAARLYKSFRGTDWMLNTLLTATLVPGFTFACFLVIDISLLSVGSSGAVPVSTLLTLVVLWFGVSVPLVFLGAYVGFRKDVAPHPVRTNQIPRLVPPQPWYMHPALTTIFGGILPFGAVSVELFFVMSAIWLHQIYYIFGFLFLVSLILVATCAEITILLCYFQLCNEDYNWWWRAMLSSGACAGYVFLYAVWYFVSELEITGGVPSTLYFGYMILVSGIFFLVTGTIGFYACLWFVNKIYGSIKVD
jgi:transmembrane 9 superfamily protein 2/4